MSVVSWRDPVRHFVDHDASPAVDLEGVVVIAAEQHPRIHGRGSTLCKWDDVVGLAPLGWCGAAGHGAAAVAGDHR
jgi:hypothetical protein